MDISPLNLPADFSKNMMGDKAFVSVNKEFIQSSWLQISRKYIFKNSGGTDQTAGKILFCFTLKYLGVKNKFSWELFKNLKLWWELPYFY